MLLRTIRRYQVQHNNSSQDAVLHCQSHIALCRHLYDNTTRVLYAGKFRRKDYHGNYDSQLAQHFSASRRRNQPSYFASDATDRQVLAVHDGSCDVLDNDDSARIKYSLPVAVDPCNGAVGSRIISKSSASSSVHAKTAGQAQQGGQFIEGITVGLIYAHFVHTRENVSLFVMFL